MGGGGGGGAPTIGGGGGGAPVLMAGGARGDGVAPGGAPGVLGGFGSPARGALAVPGVLKAGGTVSGALGVCGGDAPLATPPRGTVAAPRFALARAAYDEARGEGGTAAPTADGGGGFFRAEPTPPLSPPPRSATRRDGVPFTVLSPPAGWRGPARHAAAAGCAPASGGTRPPVGAPPRARLSPSAPGVPGAHAAAAADAGNEMDTTSAGAASGAGARPAASPVRFCLALAIAAVVRARCATLRERTASASCLLLPPGVPRAPS
eukprot:5330793-Prymnesium_polylepis.1